ncbi:MAG: LysM peptidoglycan-binding domain-containing protein, partial [Phaeodactylibacter sp.]|nr:LysM peptidoglycan-binding domain-containing protein [Phaeodactylibacter sp.]
IDFEGEVDLPEKEPEEVKTPLPTPPVKDRPPVSPPKPETKPTTPTPPAPENPVKPDEGFGEQPTAPPAPPAVVYHTVEKGDTLYNISRRYNTTVEDVKKLNGLASNIISIGQRLRVK